MAVDVKLFVARLNEDTRRALEAAAGLAMARGHYNIEVEHWLIALIDRVDSQILALLRDQEVDPGRLAAELGRSIERLRTGNARPPALSPDLVQLVEKAWLVASLAHGGDRIASGHLLVALLDDEHLAREVRDPLPELRRLSLEQLRQRFATVVADAGETARTGAGVAGPAGSGAATGSGVGAGSGLDQYTIDLTAQARAGRIDPVLGRDGEIRQAIDILTRRRQNNPILTGEAGVGKTAVVEGLAQRIAAGDVPEALATVALRTLDLGLLQAGASVKGEFENRLRGVIDAVKASPQPIILFIDEAHTLIGAGGAAGQNDAANLLKPALARGELRTIAATTWAEYKKYFEKDAALTRRFQVIRVDEPPEPMAVAMVRGLVPTLEAHHGVRILDEALRDAVRLSARYIPARQLPDKAVSLIDTACARVAMSQAAVPPAIEDARRRLELIATELGIIDREAAAGIDHAERRAALLGERQALEADLAALDERWARERDLVTGLGARREALESAEADQDQAERLAGYRSALAELRALQGESPLIHPVVDGQAVAEVVEGWTGIPAGRMRTDEINAVLNLEDALQQRVIGQPHALQAMAEAIRISRAGLTDPRKPIGVFLLVGTSGVGKTESALALADLLYGGEQSLTVINMTEFKEEHKVSLLMGSPPGYVGYGEGGVLTEAVRRRPYSVVLLDEIEKAHPGVQDVFYQVFDKGTMTDGEGRRIDFKNTVIIMTSNAGTDLITKLFADPETAPEGPALGEALRPELEKVFKPAFLGRVTVVPYLPLAEPVIREIVRLQLARLGQRIRSAYGADLDLGPGVVEAIASRCRETASGARNVESIITRTILPELSVRALGAMAEGQAVGRVGVAMGSDGGLTFAMEPRSN